MKLEDEFQSINNYFSPKIIGEVNDVFIKIAKIKGNGIPWHIHDEEDEMFYIIDGQLLMEIKNEESFRMNPGDLFIVKKGTCHRVSSEKECKILLVESKSTQHTGNVITEITRSIVEQYYD